MKLPNNVVIELSIEEVNLAIEKFLSCRGVDVTVNKVDDRGYPVTHFEISVDFRQSRNTLGELEKIDMYIDAENKASKAPCPSTLETLTPVLKDIVCPLNPIS